MSSVVAGRAVRQCITSSAFARCSRPQYLRLRAQSPSFKPPGKSFSASARVAEKKYTEDHEWIEVSSDGKTGTIGISEYAAKALGDVVFVELPTVDLEVSQGDSIGAIESVKSASDIMTPVSGKIVAANSVLEDKPGTINQSPEADGWLAKLELKDASEIENLMDAAGYKQFTEDADGH